MIVHCDDDTRLEGIESSKAGPVPSHARRLSHAPLFPPPPTRRSLPGDPALEPEPDIAQGAPLIWTLDMSPRPVIQLRHLTLWRRRWDSNPLLKSPWVSKTIGQPVRGCLAKGWFDARRASVSSVPVPTTRRAAPGHPHTESGLRPRLLGPRRAQTARNTTCSAVVSQLPLASSPPALRADATSPRRLSSWRFTAARSSRSYRFVINRCGGQREAGESLSRRNRGTPPDSEPPTTVVPIFFVGLSLPRPQEPPTAASRNALRRGPHPGGPGSKTRINSDSLKECVSS